MSFVFLSLIILFFSGALSFCFNRFNKLANYAGCIGSVIGCLIGLFSLITISNNISGVWAFKWQIPYGSFAVGLDSLSALFLLIIFILGAVTALYGLEYLEHYYGKKNIGSVWLLFNVLIAGMVLVVIARNAVFFLLAWEAMSISSFFLVLFEGEKKQSVKAGLIYIVATHIGTLFLLVMFVLLSGDSGSFDFGRWTLPVSSVMSSIIFVCAFIGFGTKAGFMPMHVWLPEAHPVAPSHVSAIMSGVMVKTGIYGLIRIISFLGIPCLWWGYMLIVVGIVSGILGVLFALAQHNLKRLLAYSTIENVGIIAIGIGLGVLGMGLGNIVLTVMGFAGGLLHVVNHAFFKGLLFCGAGVISHKTGTLEIDVLGGLFKKIPLSGICFLVGVVSICGLPPFNGFISEFLIYLSSFNGILGARSTIVISACVIIAMALIGGLAVVCFTKTFGIIFLGEPRNTDYERTWVPGFCMRTAMSVLAVICILMGLFAPFIAGFLKGIIFDVTGVSNELAGSELYEVTQPLFHVSAVMLIFYFIIVLVMVARIFLLKGRDVCRGITWDCGYSLPNTRMQYTGSSFVQNIADFFNGILMTRKRNAKILGYFPDKLFFKTETGDFFGEKFFEPFINLLHRLTERLVFIQHGQLQIYILYILVTIITLFIWKL